MNGQTHLILATTLSMGITFILHNSLRDSRSNESKIQRVFIDPTRDTILLIRCLFNGGENYKTCYYPTLHERSERNTIFTLYFLSVTFLYVSGLYQNYSFMLCWIRTIVGVWYFARFCIKWNIWCGLDIFTIYLIVYQIMSVITKWETQQLPHFSLTFFRGWLCLSTAFQAYLLYDAIGQYLPLWVAFAFLWISSVEDILTCLYVEQCWKRKKKNRTIAQLSRCGFYHTWDVDERQSNGKIKRLSLGLGDFLMFNFMLLLVLNPSSSLRTNLFILLGHIIAVHIGHEGTRQLGIIYQQSTQPALPLSVITFSTYALLLYPFLQY